MERSEELQTPSTRSQNKKVKSKFQRHKNFSEDGKFQRIYDSSAGQMKITYQTLADDYAEAAVNKKCCVDADGNPGQCLRQIDFINGRGAYDKTLSCELVKSCRKLTEDKTPQQKYNFLLRKFENSVVPIVLNPENEVIIFNMLL